MKKFIFDLIISDLQFLNDQYFLLILKSDIKLPEMYPGQFAEVRIDNSSEVFLRRPVSINYVDEINNELWLLIQQVGAGTRKLSTLKQGDLLNLILPLGTPFTIPESKESRILLIGGGVGIAPMLFLGSRLHDRGYNCDFLLGARTEPYLVQKRDFERLGTLYCTTEDGSFGEKGYVTSHSILQHKNYDIIYCCGPTPMMKAVAGFAASKNIFCEVSLENTMACGFGACLCCVTDTTEGHLCVCTEGPVFNITKLKW